MSKLPSFQFYTGDWLKDPALRSVSSGSRGLWIDMLCLMHECVPRGYLQLKNGNPMTIQMIARSTGNISVDEVADWLRELESCGVVSRSETGVYFSRRMVRDESKRARCVEAGKRGGNPTLKGLPKGGDNGAPKGSPKQTPTPSSSASAFSFSDLTIQEQLILKEKERLIQNRMIPNAYSRDSTSNAIASWMVYFQDRFDGKRFSDFQLEAQLRWAMQEKHWGPDDLEKSIEHSKRIGANKFHDPANTMDKPKPLSFVERLSIPSSEFGLPVRDAK